MAVSCAQPTTPPPLVVIVPAANLDPTARCEPFNSTVCNDIIPPGSTDLPYALTLTAAAPIYINSSAFPQSFLEVQASDIASAFPTYHPSSHGHRALTLVQVS